MIDLPWEPEKLRDFCKAHAGGSVPELVLHYTGGRNLPHPDFIKQLDARQRLRDKAPEWAGRFDLYLPDSAYLSQASSTETAQHKSQYVSGRVADLTGGSGIDALQMSHKSEHLTLVEPDEEVFRRTEYNLTQWNAGVEMRHTTAEDFLATYSGAPFDWIYLDPSRRDEKGRRTVALHRMSPDIMKIKDDLHAKAKRVMIKLSPLFDLTEILRQWPEVYRLEVVARKGEVKEILVFSEAKYKGEVSVAAVEVHTPGKYLFETRFPPEGRVETSEPQQYLYDPSAAITKAQLSQHTAREFGLSAINQDKSLFTSNQLKIDYPGRVFQIQQVGKAYKLDDLPRKLSIVTRGFPEKAEIIRKRLRAEESAEYFLFACTLSDRKSLFIYATRCI